MPKSRVEVFLSREDEQEIVDAILQAEQNTSGEIRVHMEGTAKGNAFERARELFYELKMQNTRDRNGVLFYVAVEDRKFAIYGDRGINHVVPADFWEDTRTILESHFKKGAFKAGLVEAILRAGRELKAHFPWKSDDTNELDNEISKA